VGVRLSPCQAGGFTQRQSTVFRRVTQDSLKRLPLGGSDAERNQVLDIQFLFGSESSNAISDITLPLFLLAGFSLGFLHATLL
jgi:hypothetical protein